MFLDHNISILKWLPKDHVTLNIYNILLTNISQYYCFYYILDQITTGLDNIRKLFQNNKTQLIIIIGYQPWNMW